MKFEKEKERERKKREKGKRETLQFEKQNLMSTTKKQQKYIVTSTYDVTRPLYTNINVTLSMNM